LLAAELGVPNALGASFKVVRPGADLLGHLRIGCIDGSQCQHQIGAVARLAGLMAATPWLATPARSARNRTRTKVAELSDQLSRSETFALKWSDLLFREGLIAVRAKLKGGKFRYVPLKPELAIELKRYPVVLGEEKVFPHRPGAKGELQRLEKSFGKVLEIARIEDSRFHDLRHTFASWYMMNGGDERRRSLRAREDSLECGGQGRNRSAYCH